MPISRLVSCWAVSIALLAPPLLAQQASRIPPRIAQNVDNARLVTLRGNTHPLARAEYDQGAAPQNLPMERILLLLSRSPEQEAALEQLIEEQQDPGSAHFHQWLTPEQFGERFGPASEDIDRVTAWLTSYGFRVDRVANGRGTIEFSGTAGQVERALHTGIHSYLVHGEQHWANARDPQIPAALSPVVAGIVSLHDFPMKATRRNLGTFRKRSGDGKWVPDYTVTLSGEKTYLLAPYDFAKIYNVLPAWSAGIDGTGQTIAIVGRSNISLSDVRNFRSLFGLPARDPIVTLNGADPGTSDVDNEAENVSDVEWAGAVAKGATINLVVSKSTITDGSALSSQYIVDNNVAPVVSSSYGSCELLLMGQTRYTGDLWQQAAAEGITVVVGSGDSGPANCDQSNQEAMLGLQVNGIASTPYNVAVGGTDFDDVLQQTDAAYWSSSNDPATLASVKSYVPETPWNDSCADPELVNYFGYASGEAFCNSALAQSLPGVVGGSGGASGTYAKPSWQAGVNGIPADGHRDLPDVSFFAGSGFKGQLYPSCQADNGGACNASSPGGPVTSGGGGTSYSAPAFAGVMALINQKTGSRQGLANPRLYQLAATQYGSSTNPATSKACDASYTIATGNACVFYDVTTGTIDVPCLKLSLNCYVANTSDLYGLLSTSNTALVPAYSAVTGYDLATGLGSVNVANLVTQWATGTNPAPVLSVTKSHTGSFTQGQTGATYTVRVSNGASAGPTTATVSVGETVPVGLTLVSMAGTGWACSGATCTRSDVLAAGASYPAIIVTVNVASTAPSQVTNQVTASGGGSVSAAASDVTNIVAGTSPTAITLTASPATIATTGSTTLSAFVGIVTAYPLSGTVTFNLGSTLLGSAAVTMDGAGYSTATLVVAGTQLAVGSNTITATYGGNTHFSGSSASVVVTVTQSASAPVLSVGKSHTGSFTQGQTGATYTVRVSNGASAGPTTATVSVGETVPAGLTLVSMAGTGWACSGATCTRSDVLAAGANYPAITVTVNVASTAPSQVTNQVTVSGGGSVSAAASDVTNVIQNSVTPTTTALTANPGSICAAGSTTLTATVTAGGSGTPAGTVTFQLGSTVLGSATLTGSGSAATATLAVSGGSPLSVGSNGITASYGGSANFAASASATVAVTVTQNCTSISGYAITTVAGNGLTGSIGDNGPAAAAELNAPAGVAVDPAGNLYIADFGNAEVRKVSPGGVITTVAGTGTVGFDGDNLPATQTRLSAITGVVLDDAGNLYIADKGNNRVRKVTAATGSITTVAGSGPAGFNGDGVATSVELSWPYDVALDPAGNLYIADTVNSRIRKVTPAGALTTVAGNGSGGFGPPSGDGGPATEADLDYPTDVAVDSAGNIFIAEWGNSRIRKVTVATGIISTVAGTGTAGFNGDGVATSSQLSKPWGVAVDNAGNLFIADNGNNRIRKVTPAGAISTVAGTGTAGYAGDGGSATSAQLASPEGIAVDSAGDIFFTDGACIRKLTPVTAPSITAGGVVNAASYSAGAVAPGEMVSIFGTALGPANGAALTLDSSGKVATSIGGVTVSFNGFLAPLTYAGSNQINVVVPYEIAGNSAPTVQVTYGGQTSSQYALQLTTTAPAIFTYNGSGSGPGAILNADSTVNTQSNPAPAGSVVQIFMTGEGLTTPAQATGAVTPVNTSGTGPLTPAPQQPVSVTIGGQPANVYFAGEAPDVVAGVLQVDAIVPPAATSGANSLVVQVGTQPSQSGVTVWVK
jgi:uncharacterized protein (TIGR03437 family)